MEGAAAAFADLLVDYEERRIDDKPWSNPGRPDPYEVDNYFNAAAEENPALKQWHNFRPGDDHEADALQGIARGQSHRRNIPKIAQTNPPVFPRHPYQVARLRATVEEEDGTRRTVDQPAVVNKPAPSKSLQPAIELTNNMFRPRCNSRKD